MFYIVEDEQSLLRLEQKAGECFLDIVTSNDLYHPKLTELVAVYIRPLDENETQGYIIPISHDEGLTVSKDRVVYVLKSFSKIYVLDKKRALYHFNLGQETVDLGLKYSMLHFDSINVRCTNKTVNWFYNRYGGMKNLNRLIPLTKIYERSEEYFEQVRECIHEPEPVGFQYYNEYGIKAYFMVEQSGLRVDTHSFIENFKPLNPDFSIDGETVYTSYNMYNVTSRPTNSFNSINFLAIPKGEEFRRCWKPQNDYFVELDFDGYHIRLVSEQIGYQLDPAVKAHKQLAKLWTGKDGIDEVEYGKIKGLNFQIIYGAIPEEYREVEFAFKVQNYIDDLWKQYKKQGYVKNPISRKRFTHELKDMKPNKLMNYMIQSLETARNIQILWKVLRYLSKNKCKSKVVLITYDAFTFDWSKDDGEQVLQDIRQIMEDGGFPVSVKQSRNLNF